jgi:acetyl esterase/lipase
MASCATAQQQRRDPRIDGGPRRRPPQEPTRAPEGCTVVRDIVYARAPGKDLTLDIYRPDNATGKLPVIVWVHGGGWQSGSKDRCPAAPLARDGYAVVSINYRLSHEAIFPAQIHDCKAAIRFLRANAGKYGLAPERIGAWGSSAGAHLVALLGTSGGVDELEGDLGNAQQSSRVQCVVDFFGPTDFTRMDAAGSNRNHDAPNSPESKLIGGPIQQNKDKVARANPITYVTPDDPPFLILHGDMDETVPFNQSELLRDALKKAGVPVTFEPQPGKGHGFGGPQFVRRAREFFDKHLKGAAATRPEAPAPAPVIAKAAPVGIFALMEGDRVERPVRNLAGHGFWNNPNVAGVTLRTFWSKVEPAPQEWNWMLFDEGLELARNHNKRLGLSLAAGAATPEWVFGAGANRFEFTLKTNFKADEDARMPLPWDAVFLDKWGEVVRAMGKRYDGDPHVAYVMIGGPGHAIETYFAKKLDDAAKLNTLGGAAKWVEGAKQVIDLYAAAFPTTPFILAMAPPVPSTPGEAALREIVAHGTGKYPGRFGVMHHGLNAQSSAGFLPNQLVRENSGKTTVGFQMVWSTQGQNASRVKGTLREALARAAELRAHFVEVYAADCDDASYDGDLREAGNALAENRR